MNPKLSVVIPAYNEEKRISGTLNALTSYFSLQAYPAEIIVVDDGSVDATAEIVRKNFPNVRCIRYEKNTGKGFAVKTGMMAAKGEIHMYYDADGSTPIEEIQKIWQAFEEQADIVIGSRALPDSVILAHQSKLRENMGRTYNKVLRLLKLTRFSDTQCGFKALTSRASQALFPLLTMNRFSFDAELLFLAEKMGFRIVEIPVCWINSADTRVRLVLDSLGMLLGAATIRLNWTLGKYQLTASS